MSRASAGTAGQVRASAGPPKKPWLFNPTLDLVIGAGGWTLPLLLLTGFLSSSGFLSLSFLFYLLSVFCNNPHYMATIQRAYATREDRSRYKVFTIYVSVLLAITAVAVHLAPILLPVLVTLYLTWSPWHYTGQNFGIGMLFARRAGVNPDRITRNMLYGAFVASYAVWFVSMHSVSTGGAWFWSLGIPRDASYVLRVAFLCVALFCGTVAVARFFRQAAVSALAPLLVILGTQSLWFLLPSVMEFAGRPQNAPIYYATGALAFMHCAQYLWITTWFDRKRHESAANAPIGRSSASRWSFARYYGWMIVGGIALFVPGPWLVSRVFHQDFVESFLIFTALVNLHHFILDGAIWKLRDGRVARFLLGSGAAKTDGQDAVTFGKPWILGTGFGARMTRYGLVGALIALAGLDQWQYYCTSASASTSDIARAAKINPYDTRVYMKEARELAEQGQPGAAIRKLEEAVRLNPLSEAQFALGTLLLQNGDYKKAFEHYRVQEHFLRPDLTTQLNMGVLEARNGQVKDAAARFQDAVAKQPDNPVARLNLAEALVSLNRDNEALEQYEAYMSLARKSGDPASLRNMAKAGLNVGAIYARQGRLALAKETLQGARKLARAFQDSDTEKLADDRLEKLERSN